MGSCLSSGSKYIENNDGGEEEYNNRFLEDKVLGEGQFGVVRLVTDMKANNGQGEAMACKTLKKGVVFRDNTIYAPLKPEVLQGECAILKVLAGNHFCLKLAAIYETPKTIYVVTELCTGGEMMEYVSKQDNLRTEDVSRISFQLIDAVSHCAKHRVIHRDIKPENTMFMSQSAEAELRLIDFGSGVLDKEGSVPERHTTFAGSAFYISPEMFQRTYTSKTDVWSCGATLYVLVAGYPAEELQKAFNILQKHEKRNLRNLPGMPEEMPDSYVDMLDQLMCYRHKQRKTAGMMLKHDFVEFHKKHAAAGISIADVAAAAAAGGQEPHALGEGSTGRPLLSIHLKESVRRHSVFLNYQTFERSVTALLATFLTKPELDELIIKVKSTTKPEAADTKSDETTKPTTLQVIPINELKEIMKEMKCDKCLEQMTKLPNAGAYERFAYHIALLQQFAFEPERAAQVASNSKKLRSSSSAIPSSVHGSSVFASFRKKKSAVALRRANSSENVGVTSSY